ncbi:MAG: vitamin K epoxide reductase family protein [Anaerolineales bacterium]
MTIDTDAGSPALPRGRTSSPEPGKTARPAWDRWGRWAVVAASIGLIDALYLTWLKLVGGTAACAGIGNCELVNSSRYASLGGVPIAALGALSYVAILGLLALDRWSPSSWTLARLGVFGVALTGSLYSAYLTYLEVAVLHAICPYCVLSAVMMVSLLFISVVRLRAPE